MANTMTFPAERVERLRESAMLHYQSVADALGIRLRQSDPFGTECEQAKLAACDRIIEEAGWTGETESVSLPPTDQLRYIVQGALYDAVHDLWDETERWGGEPSERLETRIAEGAFFAAKLRELWPVTV